MTNPRYTLNNFDIDRFIEYVTYWFDISDFCTRLIYNAVKNDKSHTLDSLVYNLSDLTEIDFDIITAFCSDEILTESSKKTKYQILEIWVLYPESRFDMFDTLQHLTT